MVVLFLAPSTFDVFARNEPGLPVQIDIFPFRKSTESDDLASGDFTLSEVLTDTLKTLCLVQAKEKAAQRKKRK